jgi:hypothetical protein
MENKQLFEEFKKYVEDREKVTSTQNGNPQKPVAKNLENFILTIWGKYWKYIAIIGLVLFATFRIVFPYLNELMPDKHLFDEGSYTQLIFSFIANMCALVFSIFISWLAFKTSDMFMGKSSDSKDGWAYLFDNLDKVELNSHIQSYQGKLWKVIISLFIFCFFYFMFLYGVGLPK